jgi:hypothetical protein
MLAALPIHCLRGKIWQKISFDGTPVGYCNSSEAASITLFTGVDNLQSPLNIFFIAKGSGKESSNLLKEMIEIGKVVA